MSESGGGVGPSGSGEAHPHSGDRAAPRDPSDPAGELDTERASGLGRDEQQVKRLLERYQYQALALSALILVSIATAFYMIVEGWDLVDTVYFCVIAGTTVGLGDITPKTDAGKLFTIAYVISTIGLIGTLLDLRMKRHGRRMVRRRMRRRRRREARGKQA